MEVMIEKIVYFRGWAFLTSLTVQIYKHTIKPKLQNFDSFLTILIVSYQFSESRIIIRDYENIHLFCSLFCELSKHRHPRLILEIKGLN